MGYLRHIKACNRLDPSGFIPFFINGVRVGRVRPELAIVLGRWPALFDCSNDSVGLKVEPDPVTRRSEAFDQVLSELVRLGEISHLHGEQYIATPGTRAEGILAIDRTAAPYFGIRAFGQHVNGFVRENGEIKMWLGRRAADRRNFPGCLDNLAAGGLPVIAHPARYGLTRSKLAGLIGEFRELGGVGLEVVSGSHSRDETLHMAAVSREHRLLASAGSDFHGPENPWVDLGRLRPLPQGCRPIWEADGWSVAA